MPPPATPRSGVGRPLKVQAKLITNSNANLFEPLWWCGEWEVGSGSVGEWVGGEGGREVVVVVVRTVHNTRACTYTCAVGASEPNPLAG